MISSVQLRSRSVFFFSQSNSILSFPICSYKEATKPVSTHSPWDDPAVVNNSGKRFVASFFHFVICVGWMENFEAISEVVLRSRRASIATLAFSADPCFFRFFDMCSFRVI